MQIERYIVIVGRLADARRRGDDVDHYVDELHSLWAAMGAAERMEVRTRLKRMDEEAKRAAA